MIFPKRVIFSTLAAALLLSTSARPQVAVGVNIGPAPICPYGYFDYAPYDCAPYGYYGPDWFLGGVFIGAGPWFHGFYGHPGFYGRPGWGGHGFVGRPGFGRGPVGGFHGGAGGGFHGGAAGGFHGGAVAHGGGGFHGGGGRR